RRSAKRDENTPGHVQIVGAVPDLLRPEQSLGHDPIGVERGRKALVLAESSSTRIEELGGGEAQHVLCGLTVSFDRCDAITLEEAERGPRIGIDLTLAVSSSRPRVVEVK